MSVEVKPAEKHLLPAAPDQLKQLDAAGRLNGLRGMAWAYSVLHQTGYTASGASKKFSPSVPGADTPSNSKIFYQYLRGDRVPARGARGKYGFDLVNEVERDARAKGSARWLEHSLWKIFDPATTESELAPFLEEDGWPPLFGEFMLEREIPSEHLQSQRERDALELQIFDDFVAVCAFYRLGHLSGYEPPGYALLEYLIPQASLLEPVFGYIQAPFMTMVRDFYRRTIEPRCTQEGELIDPRHTI